MLFADGTRPVRVPTVLSVREVERVLAKLPATPDPPHRLMAELLYGCGLRLMECCTLRVRDLDFDRVQILVRQGKGDKNRTVMLPAALRRPLAEQVERVKAQWRADLECGGGHAPVPDAVWHKMPKASRELPWQYLFPSAVLRFKPGDPRRRRWHAHPTSLDRAVRRAARAAGLMKRVTCHLPPQLRDAPAGGRVRRAAGADAARAREPQDHDDLHARDEQAIGDGG